MVHQGSLLPDLWALALNSCEECAVASGNDGIFSRVILKHGKINHPDRTLGRGVGRRYAPLGGSIAPAIPSAQA